MSSAGAIVSFVFELAAYWLNGQATQANASVAASRAPPNRRPTSASLSRQMPSKRIEVNLTAGRLSHLWLQPKIA